jgi:hypothetical protein
MNAMIADLAPVNYVETRGFVPHVNLSLVIMQAYISNRLPDPVSLCPEDKFLQEFRRRVVENRTNPLTISPDDPIGWLRSSYQFAVPYWWQDRDQTNATVRIVDNGFVQFTGVNNIRLGRRNAFEVQFASQKALFYEQFSWHENRPTHFSINYADNLVTAFDGSSRRLLTRDVNRGGFITASGAIIRQNITYSPIAAQGQPILPPGVPATNPIRWLMTLDGLKGVDWSGTEPYARGLP